MIHFIKRSTLPSPRISPMPQFPLDTLAATLVENSQMGILVFTDEIVYANPALEKISGYTQEELARMKVWEIFHPSYHETIQSNVAQRKAGIQTADFYRDMIIRTKKSKFKWVRSFAKTVPYGDGFAGMVNLYEITDQKLLEMELAEVYRTMSKKVAEAVAAQSAQEQLLIQQSKMAAMGEMVAAIAHQWRQPLNMVGLLVQDFREMFASEETTQADIDDTIYFCMNQINYMSQTIDDFQNYLKPSNESKRFDVNETLKGTMKLLGDRHLRHQITTELSLAPEALYVEGLENEFKQVLLILLNNAMDAIGEHKAGRGHVRIETHRVDGQAQIVIQDDAGGIPEALLERVFDNYFTTKKEKGTGLGLFMARNIVQEHMRGTLEAANEGDGARFVIKLPSVI